jgi:hypothetical protein
MHLKDLNSGAAMWGVKSIDAYDTTTIHKLFDQPRKFDLERAVWGKRGDLVRPMTIHEAFHENNIYLGDFGMAIENGTAVTTIVQAPIMFCALERFHKADTIFAIVAR